MNALEHLSNTPTVWSSLTRVRLSMLRAAFVFLAMTAAVAESASATSRDDEARTFFVRFVAAQNAHDPTAVAALLWESPDMLWLTRGVEVRGKKAITETLTDYYAGTWHLDPDMSHFKSTAITTDVVQILVPITFTRGLAGKPAQNNTFLISQILIRSADGWRVAAILPIANTQLK
ncbi:nuclear transport factor 2 family protein [Sphingomonas sp. PL20]|uniref:nuclear transport factor 2 family protein n=1 Tax=Sphingomonas sp. PL20 TaxID=2760712 RepID=UPI001AE446E8